MTKFNKLFILTIDCEGEYYSELNGSPLDVAVRYINETISRLYDKVDKIVLMSTPAFVAKAHELGMLQSWIGKAKVEQGLHVHPDDLPEVITAGLEFYRKDEKHLTNYCFSEQEQIIKSTINFLRAFQYDPFWFRGGFFDIDDNTVKVLKASTGIRLESHNIYRKEYKIKNTGEIESSPVLASDNINEIRFENSDANILHKLMEENHHKYHSILALTHSYALNEALIKKIVDFIEIKTIGTNSCG